MPDSPDNLRNMTENLNYYGDAAWAQIAQRFRRHERIFGLRVAAVSAEAPQFDLDTGDVAGRRPGLRRRIMFRLGF